MPIKEPLTNVAAWSIYADALNLLAQTFWITLLVGYSAVLLVAALGQDAATATTLGIAAATITWPITFGLHASRIKKWAATPQQ
jgi:hypothetical protein